MKRLLPFLLLLLITPLHADEATESAVAPTGPLNELEKKFVGKWRGERMRMRWEMIRKEDRTFEIAFSEPIEGTFFRRFRNYATGIWWIEGKKFHFEWQKWSGDDGDFSGVLVEEVKEVEEDRIVTLSPPENLYEPDDNPENVEVRVEKLIHPAWKLKPAEGESD